MDKPKVLIVDDAATVLQFQKFVLEKEGYDILTASNGQEGLDTALANKPSVILLDIMMPVMDGIECCRRLRENGETRQTPIIMVTTRSEVDKVEAAKEAGCTDYVFKPVNPQILKTKIKQYLDGTAG